jgi:hypothetical protein
MLVAMGCDELDEASTTPATLTSNPADDAGDEDPTATDVAPQQSPVIEQAAKPQPARIADKTFDDIKFDIEPDAPFDRQMLTEDIEALAGKRIRIRGWMLPTFQRSGITQFVLVRDNQECCFGPGAALYDCIVVDMVGDASADFSTQAIAVEGKFSIDELVGPDGKHLAIYHLDGERAE